MRWIRILVVALVAGAGLLLFQYGTLSPCGMLRVEARQHAPHGGGGAALLATAFSDSVLDTLLAARYSPLTPRPVARAGAAPLAASAGLIDCPLRW